MYDDMQKKICEQIVHSLKAVKSKLVFRKSCFELMGYDFIVDREMNMHLIEVNTNPCLEESSALLRTLLPRMVDDMLKITVDQAFVNNNNASSPYKVNNYTDEENLWNLIYSYN